MRPMRPVSDENLTELFEITARVSNLQINFHEVIIFIHKIIKLWLHTSPEDCNLPMSFDIV